MSKEFVFFDKESLRSNPAAPKILTELLEEDTLGNGFSKGVQFSKTAKGRPVLEDEVSVAPK